MSYGHQVVRANSRHGPPERIVEEPVIPVKNSASSGTVTCVYQTNILGFWRNVTITWSKNLMNVSFIITVDGAKGESSQSCKIELKPWHFWSKKGYKSFEIEDPSSNNNNNNNTTPTPTQDRNVDDDRPLSTTSSSTASAGHLLEIYWDLRSAKFSGSSPEPSSDYYVCLVSDEEIVLILGDYKKKAYKRTKKRPALVDAIQSFKKEIVYAKKSFSTRARFADGASAAARPEHDIVVESSTSGPKDPEMWISIDGIVLVHVRNLQWKFRGNETVVVNKVQVQVFWDVHSWLFCSPGTSYGLFIFKPVVSCGGSNGVGGDQDGISGEFCCTSDVDRETAGSESGAASMFYSAQSVTNNRAAADFCLFLNAWKLE